MTDFKELIPEMARYEPDIDVKTWVNVEGSVSLAIGYSAIFWPGFVEFEGYVLREGFSVDSLRDWERACAGSRRSIEAVMNHLHIGPIHTQGEATPERLVYLGRIFREIHQAKLAWQFPSKRFEVRFDDSPAACLADYQLTFYQIDGVDRG